MDIAGTLGLIEVPFGIPEVHFQHCVEVPRRAPDLSLDDGAVTIK
jgi:hypothetical protein